MSDQTGSFWACICLYTARTTIKNLYRRISKLMFTSTSFNAPSIGDRDFLVVERNCLLLCAVSPDRGGNRGGSGQCTSEGKVNSGREHWINLNVGLFVSNSSEESMRLQKLYSQVSLFQNTRQGSNLQRLPQCESLDRNSDC